MYLKLAILLAYFHFAISENYDKVDVTCIYQTQCPDSLQYIEDQLYPGYKKLSNYINLETFPLIRVKVNVTYIYQTRCGFCLKYIDKQLYPGYKKLSDYINIEIFPIVGRIDSDGKITSKHGDNECFISKAQACVFERTGVTEAIKVEFLYCSEAKAIEGNDVTDADIKACVESLLKDIVSYDTVQTCMSGNESVSVLRKYKDKADKYGVESVPWLAFSGQYTQRDYKHLSSNFVLAVCNKLTIPPDACSKSSSSALSIVFYVFVYSYGVTWFRCRYLTFSTLQPAFSFS